MSGQILRTVVEVVIGGLEKTEARDAVRRDAVAGRLLMSARTLQRKLKAVEMTFTGLVMAVRVTEAMRLLGDSDPNVTAIGYVCGFADSAHFSHSFKQVAGETPGRWREQRKALSG